MHASPTLQLLVFIPVLAALGMQASRLGAKAWWGPRAWALLGVMAAIPMGLVDARGLAVLLVPVALLLLRQRLQRRGPRLVLDLVLIHWCLAMAFHKLPGIHNPLVLSGALSPESAEYRLFWNLDKAYAALYLLEIVDWKERPSPDRRYLGIGMVAILAAMGLAWAGGMTGPEPKLPLAFLWWAPANLLLVALPEETLFRLLLLDHLETRLQKHMGGRAAPIAILLAAVFFGLAHLRGGWLYVASAAVAGIGYGCAFRYRRNPWHPVLAHFGLNALHFLCFVYPRFR